MSSEALPTVTTLADLVERLGNVPLDRIWCHPPPGTATVEDVTRIEARENRLCELVEGVLVEKPMGFRESLLAMAFGALLREFVLRGNLGIVTGSDGMLQLFDGLVRIPTLHLLRGHEYQAAKFRNIQSPCWPRIWRWRSLVARILPVK